MTLVNIATGEDGETHSWEVAEGKDAEQTGFTTCTIANDHKLPVHRPELARANAIVASIPQRNGIAEAKPPLPGA